MQLRNVGSNMTELDVGENTILFSYSTPVAACVHTEEYTGFVRTSTHYSSTTSRHINKWLDGRRAMEVSQDMLDNLVS